jgi:hypothetical protein
MILWFQQQGACLRSREGRRTAFWGQAWVQQQQQCRRGGLLLHQEQYCYCTLRMCVVLAYPAMLKNFSEHYCRIGAMQQWLAYELDLAWQWAAKHTACYLQ